MRRTRRVLHQQHHQRRRPTDTGNCADIAYADIDFSAGTACADTNTTTELRFGDSDASADTDSGTSASNNTNVDASADTGNCDDIAYADTDFSADTACADTNTTTNIACMFVSMGETTPPPSANPWFFFHNPTTGDMRSIGAFSDIAATVAAALSEGNGAPPLNRDAKRFLVDSGAQSTCAIKIKAFGVTQLAPPTGVFGFPSRSSTAETADTPSTTAVRSTS